MTAQSREGPEVTAAADCTSREETWSREPEDQVCPLCGLFFQCLSFPWLEGTGYLLFSSPVSVTLACSQAGKERLEILREECKELCGGSLGNVSMQKTPWFGPEATM